MEKSGTRKYPYITWASFVVSFGSLAAHLAGYPLLATAGLTITLFVLSMDIVRFSGTLQWVAAVLNAGLMIFLTQPEPAGFPILGLAVLIGYTMNYVRMLFFRYLLYTRLLGLEMFSSPVTIGLFLAGTLPFEGITLYQWAFPAAAALSQLISGTNYYFDHRQVQRKVNRDYPVSLNTKAPDFNLPDEHDQVVRLSDYKGAYHVLLIFVRGDWCPHCHMMLRIYQRNAKRFQEKDIVLLAVGPDTTGVNRDMAERFGLKYRLLSDPRMRVANMYGLKIPDYSGNLWASTYEEDGMPLPASFLVDIHGVVRYISRPDRIGEFLKPDTIFPIVEKLS